MDNLTKEDIADILYCLKQRREQLLNSIKFFNEVIKDANGKRLDILYNCTLGYKKDLDKIDFLILKIQKLL